MSDTSRTVVGASHVVGVGDMLTGQGPGGQIVTYALGSCIGLTVFDPVTHTGGLLHAMLAKPTSEKAAEKKPFMFITTGVPMLFKKVQALGAQRDRLVVCVAGAAEILNDGNGFQIGRRNRTMIRKLFFKNNIVVAAEDTGGNHARTMILDLSTGQVSLKNRGKVVILWTP
jgi:chemotaxis protein CheD